MSPCFLILILTKTSFFHLLSFSLRKFKTLFLISQNGPFNSRFPFPSFFLPKYGRSFVFLMEVTFTRILWWSSTMFVYLCRSLIWSFLFLSLDFFPPYVVVFCRFHSRLYFRHVPWISCYQVYPPPSTSRDHPFLQRSLSSSDLFHCLWELVHFLHL